MTQMQQFYYTICRGGRSVSGQNGFQVRAISPGLSADVALLNLSKYVGYAAPLGVAAEALKSADAPVRMALVNSPEGRLLVHACWTGEDAEGRERLGNFFAHTIVGIPETVDVLDILATWGSPQWKCNDDDGPTSLPPLSSLPRDGIINTAALSNLIQDSGRRADLSMMISAYICAKPYQQITIAGSPKDVAVLTYGLATCLPPATRRALSFSTYEHTPDAAASGTKIVGTKLSSSAAHDLDERWYRDAGSALNLVNGRRSSVPHSFFAKWMLALLAIDDFAGIAMVHKNLEARGISDPSHLELLARLLAPGDGITDSDLLTALETPALAQRALESESVCRRLATIALAASDDACGKILDKLPAVIATEKTATQTLLTMILEEACERLIERATQLQMIIFRLEAILGVLAPGESAAPLTWKAIAASTAGYTTGTAVQSNRPALSVRLELLAWWCADPSASGDSSLRMLINDWLDVSDVELPAVISSSLPDSAKANALILSICRDGDVNDAVGALLFKLPEDIHKSVCRQLREAAGLRPQLAKVLTKWTSDERSTTALEEVMNDEVNGDAGKTLDAVLEQMVRTNGLDEVSVRLATRIPRMIALSSNSASLARICERIVESMTLTTVLTAAPKGEADLLASILNSKVPLQQGARDRALCLLQLRQELARQPGAACVERAALTQLRRVLKNTNAAAESSVRATVLETLCLSCTNGADVERVVSVLGTTLASRPSALLTDIFASIRENKALNKNTPLIADVCRLALGGGADPVLVSDISAQPDLPFLVTSSMLLLPSRSMHAIQKIAGGWPEPVRAAWRRQTDLIRPRSVMARIFNFMYGLSAGALIGVILLFWVGNMLAIGGAAVGVLFLTAATDWEMRRLKHGAEMRSPAKPPNGSDNPRFNSPPPATSKSILKQATNRGTGRSIGQSAARSAPSKGQK